MDKNPVDPDQLASSDDLDLDCFLKRVDSRLLLKECFKKISTHAPISVCWALFGAMNAISSSDFQPFLWCIFIIKRDSSCRQRSAVAQLVEC